MLIDTHCHLDFPEFDADRDLVLKNAQACGITTIINIGSSLKGSRSSVELSRKYPQVFAAVGVHPHDARDCDEGTFAEIRQLSAEKKVTAIGEVGLDYFRNLSDPALQREVFEKFVEFAIERKLPLVVHCRQAEEDTLAILKKRIGSGLKGVVIHCFSGSEDFLKKCLDLGFFVSFTCNITYKKAQGLREAVRLAPLERMFLETDAPYLSPEGKRGRRNEPANVRDLAQEVARIKEIDFEKVCAATTKNAIEFFGLQV